MSVGLIGKKCGMTRTLEGNVFVPVTVVYVQPNRIVQIKTPKVDGYSAIQVTGGERVTQAHMTRPMMGHFKRAGVEPRKTVSEFRLDSVSEQFKIGDTLTVSLFREQEHVDVIGTTKGKGFQGVVKRHGFKMQPRSHGNSLSIRTHGSRGCNQTPGRVMKGRPSAGQMGFVRQTVSNLKIMKIDTERNVLLIKGAVPGAPGGSLIISSSKKKTKPGESVND